VDLKDLESLVDLLDLLDREGRLAQWGRAGLVDLELDQLLKLETIIQLVEV
jgi:hypothetical protein